MIEDKSNPDDFNYLELPANKLLEKFGEGKHIPGSGSAAAFSGMLAVELLITVCKLTLKRKEEKYTSVAKEFELLLDQLTTIYKQNLIKLFHQDILIFNGVSQTWRERDAAKVANDEREFRRLSRLANDKLKEATEIPLEIAKTCLGLIDLAFSIFERGFQSARGDSGVAISNLLSAISGALFVTLVNIRTGRKSQWTAKLREDAEIIGLNYNAKQKQALAKVFDLYKEGIDGDDYQIKLVFE